MKESFSMKRDEKELTPENKNNTGSEDKAGEETPVKPDKDDSGKEIEFLKEENAKLKDQALRALAEAENTRKRAERDVEEAIKYGVTGFARDMISILENLNRAELSIPKDDNNELIKNIGEGIGMTKRELLKIFEQNGIKRIDPLGEKFDHNFHQAVAQVDDDKNQPGTIVQVVQAGYVIKDRLLRPALVAVAKQPEKKEG